ncbi:AmmeMemoRadiSam system radical SAM enzyme [Candidatus Woesearchaeota archaeon]|nr:AmmeMemoRadiSam system radical SAM enzyme [Candidatus Woesearchaeota archaeon]
MKECLLYEEYGKKGNNLVKCKACRHRCIIGEDKTGICRVRKNINGKLYSLVYGKAIGMHIDPIEKKPLYHFLPGSQVLSFGTSGCNFRCLFCQNYDMSQSPRLFGEKGIVGEKISPESIVNFAVNENIPCIAYTYNEPAIFIEYAYETAKLANKKGIRNIYVTNGYETEEALELIKPYIDAMNIDLKSFSEEFYKNICGAKLKPVLETIKKAHELGIWIEITTLIINGKNDSKKELEKIAEFISSVDCSIPWHISRCYPQFKMNDISPTFEKTLLNAYEIGKKAGLKFVYIGNISLEDKENTFCPRCNNLLIERSRYDIIKNSLTNDSKKEKNNQNNLCKKCKTRIKGVFYGIN